MHALLFLLAATGATTPIPAPVSGLDGTAGPYAVELHWDAVDPTATGVLLERCVDAPPEPATPRCETAALLQASVRSLRHVGLRPWHFRIAAFNADGISAFSTLTPALGASIELADPEFPPLPISASQLAASIRVPAGEGRCTDPATLHAEGSELLLATTSFDGWRLPSEYCGTGGCIYLEYTVDTAGCYQAGEGSGVQGGQAPWSADGTGVQQVCSSGGGGEGGCSLYEEHMIVDSYLYWGGRDLSYTDWIPGANAGHAQTPVVPSQWPDQ